MSHFDPVAARMAGVPEHFIQRELLSGAPGAAKSGWVDLREGLRLSLEQGARVGLLPPELRSRVLFVYSEAPEVHPTAREIDASGADTRIPTTRVSIEGGEVIFVEPVLPVVP